MKPKVAVGLSGGIDSSFAAYILKQQECVVTGVTLNLLGEESRSDDIEGLEEASHLCSNLGIPHYGIDAEEIFKKEIIDYFVRSYLEGITPNPCAFCNYKIKFGFLLDKVRSWGINYLATGHYASLKKNEKGFFLKRAKDEKKSQEYFLSLIPRNVLPYLIFPLGDYLKEEVKEITKKEKIVFKERKESQDICFIKNRKYADFIEKYIGSYNTGVDKTSLYGSIKHVSGKVLGKHRGIYYFTYGQREGLGVAWKEPLYVIDIDSKTNTVVVGERNYLNKDKFYVESLNWFVDSLDLKDVKVKVRYNSPFYNCNVKIAGNQAEVFLENKIEAVAPGQIAVFYCQDIVVAGGIIAKC